MSILISGWFFLSLYSDYPFMSKTSTTELFDLIQSLTKAEKRHFKIYASRHVIGEENKYVKLFDAIASQKAYDEKHLLKNESYIRQLPLLKKRLHEAVLKSLDLFHTSVDAEIRKLSHQAEILYEKALYEQSKKILRIAKKLSQEHELATYELEILRWETKISWAQDSMEGIGRILSEEKNILQTLDNVTKYRTLNHKAFSIYYEHGIPRTPKLVREVKNILSNPLLKNPKLALSFESEHTYFHFHTVYNSMRQDYAKAYSFGLKKLFLFDIHPEKIKTYTNLYLGDLNDCIIFAISLKNYEKMEEHIQKLRALEHASLSERSKTILFFYSYHELNYYNNTGQFQKAVKRIEHLEEIFPVYGSKLTPAKRAVLYTTFAVAYFGNKNFKKSIYNLNQIRNEPLGGVRTDIESFAYLLYLIVHYEIKVGSEGTK
ncbi:MAG: hypothetical protein HY841_11455 [Bacteroidetes bacterium]|nr:hypothetical protein [Bacteroidota bacterium]